MKNNQELPFEDISAISIEISLTNALARIVEGLLRNFGRYQKY